MTTTTATPNTPTPATPMVSQFNPWRELAFIGAVIMNTTWLVMLYQAAGPHTASDPTALAFAAFAIIHLLARYFGKTLMSLRLANRIETGLIFAFFLLVYFVSTKILLQNAAPTEFNALQTQLRGLGELTRVIPGKFWVFTAVGWSVWRGIELARQGIGTFAVQRHLRFGFVMWLIYSMVAFVASRELPGFAYFILFVFATLMAMSSARVSVLGKFRGGQSNPFSRSWLGSITFVNLSTVAVGLSLAMLTTGRFAIFFQRLFGGILYTVIFLTISPILFILGLFGNTNVNAFEAPPPPPDIPPWEESGEFVGWVEGISRTDLLPPEQQTAVWVVVLGTLGVGIIIAIFGITWMYRQLRPERQIEYVVDRGDILDMFRRRAKKRRGDLLDNLADLNPLKRGQRILAAAKIRRIYTHLMDLAEDIDVPRPPSSTPLEFLATIQRGLPSTKTELVTITHAYLKVRYGELPESQEEIAAVDNAWARVQRLGTQKAKIVQARKKEEAKARKRIEKIRD